MPEVRGQYAMNPGVAAKKADEAEAEAAAEPKDDKGTLERVTITPAHNGFSVECSYRRTPKKNEPMDYQAPKPHVFNSASEVLDFLGGELGES